MLKTKNYKEFVWNTLLYHNNGQSISKLFDNNFSIAFEVSFAGQDGKNYDADIAITKSDSSRRFHPMICLNIVTQNDISDFIARNYESARTCSSKMLGSGAKEWIITNGKQFLFISSVEETFNILNIDEAFQRILSITTNDVSFIETNIWDEVIRKIKLNINYESIKEVYNKLSTLSFNDEDFIINNTTFSLKPEMELELIKVILFNNIPLKQKGKLCRYVSLEGLKRLLIEQEFSMCGLAGMNDTSEMHPFKALAESNMVSKDCISSLPHYIAQKNSFFINSFTQDDKPDDLTMWRLYGDDGKGACLTFEYSIAKINTTPNMYLLPITYLPNIPKIVMDAISIFNNDIEICNRNFKIENMELWQHFIKANEFSDEREIRLIMKNNEISNKSGNVTWILNSSNHIFHPIFKFKPVSEYPLKLLKITLGPRFPYSAINKEQIDYLIAKFDPHIKIDVSKIRFYR